MNGDSGNSAASIDRTLLDNLANAFSRMIASPEAGKPANPKYDVRHYNNLGVLIVSVPNGSAIASIRQNNGFGEVSQITDRHFPEFQLDLEKVLEQMGRGLVTHEPVSTSNDFGVGERVYEALAGIPRGVGESQYRS